MSKLDILKEAGKKGDYKMALTDYFYNSPNACLQDYLEDIQYAVAFQHRGLYLHSLSKYQEVITDITSKRHLFDGSEISPEDLLYNLKVQEAVLFSRLGKPQDAINILKAIGEPDEQIDIEIAKATLIDWYYLTMLNASLNIGDIGLLSETLNFCKNIKGRKILSFFCVIYREVLKIHVNNQAQFDYELSEAIVKEMWNYDPPGQPWLNLVLGQQVRTIDPQKAKLYLEDCIKTAVYLGKYFLVARAMDANLHVNYSLGINNSQLIIDTTRCLNAYRLCGLSFERQFTGPIYSFLTEKLKLSKSDALKLFTVNNQLFREKEDVQFNKMCKHWVSVGKFAKEWRVFEEFVSDWAVRRFVGEKRVTADSMPTADVIIVREVEGVRLATVVQSKHYLQPRKSVPQRLSIKELASVYSFDKLERYVFAVTTSNTKGWEASMWHHQDQKRIIELVGDYNAEILILTEPEFQIEVLLNEDLWRTWFQY